jgi:hypothetical protein
MSIHCKQAVATIVMLAGAAAMTQAQASPDVAAGFRVGTLGLGAEATIGISDRVNVRVPFNLFNYNYDQTEDGIDYKGKLNLQSVGALVDVHPFKGSFYLSAGIFSNGNKLKLHASDPSGTEEYEIGDRSYTSDPSNPLALKGGTDFNSMAPYLGLGWGNAIQGASSVYFRFELGAYFQGAGKVKLDASGRAVDTQTQSSFDVDDGSPEAMVFQANLEQERASLEDDIEDFKIYPAVSLALGYRFRF